MSSCASLSEAKIGTQAGFWSRNHGETLLSGSLSCLHSASFLRHPSATCSGNGPAHSGLCSLASVNNQDVSPQTTCQGNLSEAILQSRLSCPGALGCVRLTVLVTVTVSKVHGRLWRKAEYISRQEPEGSFITIHSETQENYFNPL